MSFEICRLQKLSVNLFPLIWGLLLLIGAQAAFADTKSIFDDDWTASSQKKPPATPPQPPTGASGQGPPATSPPQIAPPADPRFPVSPGTVSPPPSAPGVTRQVVPPTVKLEKSRALLRETFAKQLADKSSAAREQLCSTLLDAASKASSDPSDQYVLFGGALNAAREAGDLPQVIQIAQTIATHFWVDPQSIVTTSALNMPLKCDAPNRSVANVTAGLSLVDHFVALGELADAAKLCTALRPAAAADRNLLVVVNRRAIEVESIRLAHERILPALTKLESQPEDPAANLAVGSYKCFSLGNWDEGLPMLAKSSDANLKSLAAKELAGPKAADEVLALADGWWTISERQPGPSQSKIQHHVVALYAPVSDSLSPLQKLKVDRRIADVTAKDGPVAVAPAVLKQGIPRLKEFCELQWRKAPQRKTAIGPAITPLSGDVTWAAKDGVHTITGNVMVGENPANYGHKRPGSKATLRLEPGCFVDGGQITVSDGVCDIAGDAAHPVVLKNVKLVVETGALLKASNAVFENCSFSKGGSLRSGSFNAKFELADCLLMQSVFEKLNQADYGVKMTGCTMVDGKMPNRVNNPGSNIDTLKTATNEWSTIVDNDFYNCEFSVSAVWCLRRCNLYNCLLTSEEGIYQSDTGSLKITLGLTREDAAKLIPDLTTRTSNNRTGKLTYEASPALFAHKTFPSQ